MIKSPQKARIRNSKSIPPCSSYDETPPLKVPHSEIEKNRRQKMNKRLNDLATCLFQVSNNKSKKTDKLSVLKIAVQHMKNLKASNSVLNDSFLCQSFINFQELQALMLNRPDEFLLVLKCDTGKILYVSDSCFNAIGYHPKEILEKLLFEVIHPSDIKQVKDQLVYNTDSNGSKNDFVLNKTFNPGNRRSFICRFQNNPNTLNHTSDQYKVIQFNGYLSSELESNMAYNPNEQTSSSTNETKPDLNQIFNNHSASLVDMNNEGSKSSDNAIQHYLIAYGTVQKTSQTFTQFITKHDVDGKFTYSENCIYNVIGYLPSQLKAESIFNLIHTEDLPMLKASFLEAKSNPNVQLTTSPYRIFSGHPSKELVLIQSVLFCLKNPFSGVVEFIQSTNHVIPNPLDHETSTLTKVATHRDVNQSSHLKMPAQAEMPARTPEQFYESNSFYNNITNNQRSASYESFLTELDTYDFTPIGTNNTSTQSKAIYDPCNYMGSCYYSSNNNMNNTSNKNTSNDNLHRIPVD